MTPLEETNARAEISFLVSTGQYEDALCALQKLIAEKEKAGER